MADNTDAGSNITQRLREERKRMGASQKEFARLAGVSLSTMKRFDAGVGLPNAAHIAGWTEAGLDCIYLLTGERTRQSNSGPSNTEPHCCLRGAVREAIREEMAAEKARLRKRAELGSELIRRRSRLRAAGVPEPSLQDLLDQQEDPPSPALRQAIERIVLAVDGAAHPTPAASDGDGAQPPADRGAC